MDTVIVFALGLFVGYAFAVYHGKSKRPIVVTAPVEEETQPTPAVEEETQPTRSSRRRRNLPAIDGYVTQKDHGKEIAKLERKHQAELEQAVIAAQEALYQQTVTGVMDAYKLGVALAAQNVTYLADPEGVRLFKALSNTEVLEVVVTPMGIRYVRGEEAQLGRLMNNNRQPQRPNTITGHTQAQLPRGNSNNNRKPAQPQDDYDFIPGVDDAPPYSDEELERMGH